MTEINKDGRITNQYYEDRKKYLKNDNDYLKYL